MQKQRTVFLVSIFMVMVLVLWFGFRWLQQGNGEIVTNNKEAKIFLLHEDKKQKLIGTGSASRRLWHGDYTIQVEEGDKQSRVFLHVEKRKVSSRRVDLRDPAILEKVANVSASDIVSNGDVVRFFNPIAQMLSEIGFGKEPTYYLPDLYPVNEVRWIDFNNALVTSDGTRLSVIKDGEIQPISLDGIEVDEGYGLPADYVVNGVGDIAYTSGKEVFFGNLFKKSYRKIYTASSESIAVSLSNKGSILVYERSNDASHEQPSGAKPKPVLNIIDGLTGTSSEVSLSERSIERAKWSPDGSKLLLFGRGPTVLYEPTKSTTRELLSIRPSNVESFAWLDNNLVVYVDGGSVWVYSLKTDVTYKIGRSTEALIASDIVSSVDERGYVLFGSSSDTATYGDVGVLYRLKLPDLDE